MLKYNDDKFRVMVDDHNDKLVIHTFNVREDFYDWIEGEFDDEWDEFTFTKTNSWVDPNGDTWSLFDGIYEHDHTLPPKD